MRYSVQSGEPWKITVEDIITGFASFGEVINVFFVNSSHFGGTIQFSNKYQARKSLNKLVEVKGCILHTFTKLSELSPFPVSNQILIKSKRLPISWEKDVIIRQFFQTFGEVNGINLITKNKLLVSFKENIASRMTNTLLKVEIMIVKVVLTIQL